VNEMQQVTSFMKSQIEAVRGFTRCSHVVIYVDSSPGLSKLSHIEVTFLFVSTVGPIVQ
jgi:hypothetical protein